MSAGNAVPWQLSHQKPGVVIVPTSGSYPPGLNKNIHDLRVEFVALSDISTTGPQSMALREPRPELQIWSAIGTLAMVCIYLLAVRARFFFDD